MTGLAVLLWLLLLCSVCATIKTLASSSNAIAPHNKNAKYQESSPSSGILSTVAGYKTMSGGSDADGVPATSKQLIGPKGLAVDKDGNVFIADFNKILKVTASSGIITTVVGTGGFGYSGDGGQATSAKLRFPTTVALDTSGNIYIVDSGNSRIRKVTVSTGVISTVAGDGYIRGYHSDNVAATSTSLFRPRDVAVDTSGNIFIADTGNRRIRKVTASTGIITTIAGKGKLLDVDDGVRSNIATEYYLSSPIGVALDSAGNVYIANGYFFDSCIFKVTVSTGIITVVAGAGPYLTGTAGYNGDNILATKARLNNPEQIAFDASDNMFINDADSYRIRRVSASTGIITTVAGTRTHNRSINRSTNDGDGGSATLVSTNEPSGLAVAANGDFYFSNNYHNVVKKVTYTTGTPTSSVTAAPAVTPAVTPSTPPTATAPTPSTSSPSSSPSISKAPYTSSTTGSQSSANTHVAQTLHVTMILLSSLLILHLC